MRFVLFLLSMMLFACTKEDTSTAKDFVKTPKYVFSNIYDSEAELRSGGHAPIIYVESATVSHTDLTNNPQERHNRTFLDSSVTVFLTDTINASINGIYHEWYSTTFYRKNGTSETVIGYGVPDYGVYKKKVYNSNLGFGGVAFKRSYRRTNQYVSKFGHFCGRNKLVFNYRVLDYPQNTMVMEYIESADCNNIFRLQHIY